MKSTNMKNIVLWTLQIITALALVVLGASKIAAHPFMVEAFARIGFGEWFRYVIGTAEIAGALALLNERYAAEAAMLLTYLMLGALIAQLGVIGGDPLAVLLILSATFVIALGRIRQSRYLAGTLIY